MSAKQAALELGVSERTVRRWIASGELPATKQHGAFVVDLDAARQVLSVSRAGRTIGQAELRGRYAEVCDRLEKCERDLADERLRSERLHRVLYMPTREALAGDAE